MAIAQSTPGRMARYVCDTGRTLVATPASHGDEDHPMAWAIYDQDSGRHLGSLYQWGAGQVYLTNHRGPHGLRLGCRDFARAVLLAVRGY